MKIIARYICPPIPSRGQDWEAVDDDTYAGPGSPIGYGPTETAAIADLKAELELSPHHRRILFENDQGTCPVCGAGRGFSVPDGCEDNAACPEPQDIEASLK